MLANQRSVHARSPPLCKIMATGNCSVQANNDFSKHIDGPLMRVNLLLGASTIVIGVLVGIGAYGQRYRHHPLTSFLFHGASTLFLPILSYVVSTIGNQDAVAVHSHSYSIIGWCHTQTHVIVVFMWASLIQIAGVNTTAIVAGDDSKNSQNIAPPATILLVQAIWTSYLVVDYIGKGFDPTEKWSIKELDFVVVVILFTPFALIVAKLLVKYYAWYQAKESLAYGRNPHLIVGYMEQLEAELASEQHSLPPLIVTGEDKSLVHEEPHGYSLKWSTNQTDGTRIDNNLVTIDKIWQLQDDTIVRSSVAQQFKDLCFSFALFKLLRCRFARHAFADTGFIKAHNLFPHVLLQDGDDERAFGLIAHELSFLHDYYYSPFPLSYSKSWLPGLSIFISLLSMGWSLCYFLFYTLSIVLYDMSSAKVHAQFDCFWRCIPREMVQSNSEYKPFGNFIFYLAPLFFIAALVVLAEAREIASYMCSNWTKVSLICHYVRHASSWEKSTWKKKLLDLVLRRKCKLLNQWEDKMNQCSLLAVHPSTTPMTLLWHLIPLLDRKKVPRAVKTAILKQLRGSNWKNQSNGVVSLCTKLHLQAGNNPLSACSGVKGVADTILVVHIATSILEVRRSEPPRHAESSHEIVAMHLSRYCTYLVAHVPKLLPDYEVWCKSLYKAAQKEGKRALRGARGPWNPEALVQALRGGSEVHYVLKNGAELGQKLLELAADEGEKAAWEVLADFWSEMILYAAPSDNLNAHAEAIARGGELITLLWALLSHLGVVSQPEAAAPATTTTTPGDV